MRKHTKLSLVFAMLLCAALLLSGCGKKGLDIVGKWDNSTLMGDDMFTSTAALGMEAPKEQWIEFTKDGKMEFMADGKTVQDYLKAAAEKLDNSAETKSLIQTMVDTIPSFTYKVNGDKVELTMGSESHTMEAKLEGDTLTLTDQDGNATVFTRHK